MTAPLFHGRFCGKQLRFFEAPGDEPRFPYCSEADLVRCLNLSSEHRRIVSILHDDGLLTGATWLIKNGDKVEPTISFTVARSIINGIEISRAKAAGEIELAAAIYDDHRLTKIEAAFIAEAKKAVDQLTTGMSDSDTYTFLVAAHAAEIGGVA